MRETANEQTNDIDAIIVPILESEKIVISACDGTETFVKFSTRRFFKRKPFFTSVVYHSSEPWPYNEPGKATPDTPIHVYGLKAEATFGEMFSLWQPRLENYCFTEHQIKKFCERYSGMLIGRDRSARTFFVMKVKGNFFGCSMLGMYADDYMTKEFHIHILPLESSISWEGGFSHRLIVPVR